MNTWLKDNAAGIGAICVVLGLFGGFAKVAVVDPIHQRFDAIDQRFDAIDQRFDDLRAEMNERFDHVEQRFDHVNLRIDDLRDDMNKRFEAVNQRLDGLTGEVSELRRLTVSITERVSRNEAQIDLITERLQVSPAPTP